MTTALDWRSLPTASGLSEFERDMLYLREQGRTPSDIAQLLHVGLNVVSPALTVAARRLGFAGIKELVKEHGWPSVFNGRAPRMGFVHPGKEPVVVQRKREREDRHEPFSPGLVVHWHSAFGLERGTVKAFGTGMVLLANGTEVQRSRVHVGEDCGQ
jgi:DNA-binding CsgD family transcriptional regulator